MAITLRSSREIEMLGRAGTVVAEVLSKIRESVRPGISTAEIDKVALEIAEAAGAKVLFKGVKASYATDPFPGAICASVNEQVVHGISPRK